MDIYEVAKNGTEQDVNMYFSVTSFRTLFKRLATMAKMHEMAAAVGNLAVVRTLYPFLGQRSMYVGHSLYLAQMRDHNEVVNYLREQGVQVII